MPTPPVPPTRVSDQLASALALVPLGAQGLGLAQTRIALLKANEPLISPKATPPVPYTMVHGVTRNPTRPRIEASQVCLIVPNFWSVRKRVHATSKQLLTPKPPDEFANFHDQSASTPSTHGPPNGDFPTCQRQPMNGPMV